jgi:hypothetical protein
MSISVPMGKPRQKIVRKSVPAADPTFRFDCCRARKDQLVALEAVIRRFVLGELLRVHYDAPSDVLMATLGMSEDAAADFTAEVDGESSWYKPLDHLTSDILTGMYNGRLAGLMGTPRTPLNRWVMGKVFRYVSLGCKPCVHFESLHSAFTKDYCRWSTLPDEAR